MKTNKEKLNTRIKNFISQCPNSNLVLKKDALRLSIILKNELTNQSIELRIAEILTLPVYVARALNTPNSLHDALVMYNMSL